MNKLILVLTVLGMVGCTENTATLVDGIDAAAIVAQPDTYQVQLLGDGASFTISLFADTNTADEEQLVVGNTTIGVGEVKEYNITGFVFMGITDIVQSGVSRTNTTGTWLQIRLYKNGSLLESAQLSTNGTYHAFNHYE